MNHQNHSLSRIIATACLFIGVLLLQQVGYGEEAMQPLYTLNKAILPVLEPEIYSTKDKQIDGLMDYPADNAVATNMLGNAVTLITFKDEKAKLKTVAKNFKSYVGGGDTVYLPVFSEDTIGYSQNRGFTLLDLKTKKCDYHSIAGSFNMDIWEVMVIDAEKRLFLFCVGLIASEKPTQILRLMDLSTSEGKMIGEEMLVGEWGGVTATNKNIFVYEKNKVKAMDLNFNEVHHPIPSIVEKNKTNLVGKIIGITIHPYLSMAILSERNNSKHQTNVWVVNWGENNSHNDNQSMVKLLTQCYSFKFTADGKWVQFEDSENYYVMPVDPEIPGFMGGPILLGKIPPFPRYEKAMTRNPTGFVVSKHVKEEGYLLKWDFSKAEKLVKKHQ